MPLPTLPHVPDDCPPEGCRAARALGTLAAALGAVALVAWVLDVPMLARFVHGQVAMKFNTALGLLCGGASLVLLARSDAPYGRARSGRVLAAGLAVLGALAIVQSLLGVDLGVDQALMPDPDPVASASGPGRMAPTSAVAFLLAGLSLAWPEGWAGSWRRPAELFALTILLIATLSGLEYVTGLDLLYRSTEHTRMAVPTTLAFAALGVGILLARQDRGIVGVLRAGLADPLERRVFGGLVAGLALLLVVGLASYVNLVASAERDGRVERYEAMRLGLARHLSLVQDMETGARGFTLTGDETYLRPYREAVAILEQRQADLERLASDREEIASAMSGIGVLGRRRADLARELVESRRDGRFVPGQGREALDAGRAAMDELRVETAALDRDLARRIGDRRDADRWGLDVMRITLALGTLAGLAVVVLAIATVHRDVGLRARAEARAREGEARIRVLNSDLERRVRERTAALVASEKRLRDTLESTLEGFQILDRDWRYRYVNPAAALHGRRAREELVGQRIQDCYPGIEATPLFAEMQGCMAAQEPRHLENEFAYPDGSRRWFNLSIVPVAEGICVLSVDVDERRRAEEALRQLNEDLEQRVRQRTEALAEANHELESFTYTVSHDLRAPLRHVSGFVDLLGREAGAGLSDKARHYLEMLTQASTDMGRLIDGLLTLSRTARASVNVTRFPLGVLVRDVVAGLAPAAEGRVVAWDLGDLPDVVGDRVLLRVAFQNLLENALKYTRTRETARIAVGVEGSEEGRVVVAVRDNGVGFDPRYADRLFGVFQRLHRADEFEGTGIGLATVRRIVSRHGGRVWAEATPDAGAIFRLTLQAADPAGLPDGRGVG